MKKKIYKNIHSAKPEHLCIFMSLFHSFYRYFFFCSHLILLQWTWFSFNFPFLFIHVIFRSKFALSKERAFYFSFLFGSDTSNLHISSFFLPLNLFDFLLANMNLCIFFIFHMFAILLFSFRVSFFSLSLSLTLSDWFWKKGPEKILILSSQFFWNMSFDSPFSSNNQIHTHTHITPHSLTLISSFPLTQQHFCQ